jgi:Protein of unknown function (DUF3039)
MTQTVLETTTDERTDTGDSERVAHIITKQDQMRAFVYGEAVTALCGKRWVPVMEPPPEMERCEPCHEIMAAMIGH